MAELLCWPLSVWQCRNSFESQAGRLMRNCSSRDVDKTSNYEQAFDSRQPSTSIVVAFNSTQTSKLRYTHLWNFRTPIGPIGPRSSDFSVHWFSDVLRSTWGTGSLGPRLGVPHSVPLHQGLNSATEPRQWWKRTTRAPEIHISLSCWMPQSPGSPGNGGGLRVLKQINVLFLEIYRCICILAYRKQSVCFVVRIHVEWQIR